MRARAFSPETQSIESPGRGLGDGGHGGRRVVPTLALVLLLPAIATAAPWDITPGQPHEYNPVSGGRNCILSPIDAAHYLCLHRGPVGEAVILRVDPADWTLATVTTYPYAQNGDYMGLAAIDATHFLITYCGEDEAAFAAVLSIDPETWTIATASTLLYDPEFGYYNALSPIDATHYLGVHNMWDVTGRAGVFTVDPQTWAITYGPECAFEPESGFDFKLTRLDATHHLCLYPSQAGGYFGRAVVLVVDPSDWTVSTAHPPVTYASDADAYAFASQIDAEHFLCAYQGPGSHGWAVVLTIDPGDWSISLGTPCEYDPALGGEPNLVRIDATHHLCAYKGEGADGYAVVLTVDPSDWTVSRETPYEWDPERADYPYLCPIDAGHYLCSYEGPGGDGWALVLGVELSGAGVPEGRGGHVGLVSGCPNPCAGPTVIHYDLARAGKAYLAIADIQGRRVSTLLDRWLPSGPGSVRWDGTDGRGRRVAPGLYFCTLSAGEQRGVARLITLR